MNANMMLYRSEKLTEPSRNITMTGIFTDQSLFDETTVGIQIPMRTVIEIASQPPRDQSLLHASWAGRTPD
jgi:hypothetical protein